MPKAKTPETVQPTSEVPGEYTVVARRYRPRQFAELIGQEHVAAALVNAMQSHRVAHAYLFTGARGVGKTSAARILAKALNCADGPTPTPCDRCDSCLAVAQGDDVDVVEIDGASNNKVEEARDIRQNVGFRPTRSRYKIYIIDEVHMLTTGAFNALLKTLEEPPPHVKFILATTEVQKIPITILSRCQRFDFAQVGPAKIFEQLKRIVESEGHPAEDDALRLIALRAGGSMRDSQSLLDQILAACPEKLTAERVAAVLGTSGEERVIELAQAILGQDAKAALELLAAWGERGLQCGELVDQLIGHWRALMLVCCGGAGIRELPVTPRQREAVEDQAKRTSLDTVLAGLEVWTATRARLRDSMHAQVLLEMAVVRLCRLGELLAVGQLIQSLGAAGRMGGGLPGPAAAGTSGGVRTVASLPESSGGVKKNIELSHDAGINHARTLEANSTLNLTENTLAEVWRQLLITLAEKTPILANQLRLANSYAIFGPNGLAISFTSEYNYIYESCASEPNTRRVQEVLSKLLGAPVQVRIERSSSQQPTVNGVVAGSEAVSTPRNGTPDRKKTLMSLPMFRRAGEALGAQIWHVDDEFNPNATTRHASTPRSEDDDTDNTALDTDEI